MTLEEAIEHAEEKEKENKKLSKRYDDASGYSRSGNKDIRTNEANKCEKCAEEHRQLAEWLKDYKRLLEQEPKTGWIDGLIVKVLEEVDGGTDDRYIRYVDICDRVEKSIREYCGAKMESEE